MKSKIKCQEKYNNPWGGSRGVRGVPSNPLNWNHSRQRNCKILIRMTFWLKKVRPQNTMTWLQNVGNRISEDLNFRGCPRTPYRRPPSAVLLSNPLLWNPGSAPESMLLLLTPVFSGTEALYTILDWRIYKLYFTHWRVSFGYRL